MRDLHCPGCGYSLRGLGSPTCPECGLAVDPRDLEARLEKLEQTSLRTNLIAVFALAGFGAVFIAARLFLRSSWNDLWSGVAWLLLVSLGCLAVKTGIDNARLAAFQQAIFTGKPRAVVSPGCIGCAVVICMFFVVLMFLAIGTMMGNIS